MIYSRKNKRDGETYWFVRYPLKNGRRKKEQVPPSPDGRPTTKQDAREYLTKQKAAVDAGTWIDPSAPPVVAIVPDAGPTFAKFAETFLEKHPEKVLGHSTPTLTMRYAHLQPEHLQGAVNALDVALGVHVGA